MGFAIVFAALVSSGVNSVPNTKTDPQHGYFWERELTCEEFSPGSHLYWSASKETFYWPGCIGVGSILYQDFTLTTPASAGTYFVYGPDDGCQGPNFHRVTVSSSGEVLAFSLCF